MLAFAQKIKRRVKWLFFGHPDNYLENCGGVIHVGANRGDERELYAAYDLMVVWIEAIPDLFEELKVNLKGFPKQRAVCALVTDRSGQIYSFHVSSNEGYSSSILDLHHHRDIWPEVKFTHDIPLASQTLPEVLMKADKDIRRYDALVMDTQGSELLVLKGCGTLLEQFKYIRTEAADFEAYKDCATVDELKNFLAPLGFKMIRKDEQPAARRKEGGQYFELLFQRQPK